MLCIQTSFLFAAGVGAECKSGGGIGVCCLRRVPFPAREKVPKARQKPDGFWKSPKRRQWRTKRDGFEEVSRLAATKWSGIG